MTTVPVSGKFIPRSRSHSHSASTPSRGLTYHFQKIMAGLAGSLKSPRALFAGGVLFYLLSIWIISQQYHVTLLDKVRGGASSIKILSESGVKPSDAKNGTLGVSPDRSLELYQPRANLSSSLQKFLLSI